MASGWRYEIPLQLPLRNAALWKGCRITGPKEKMRQTMPFLLKQASWGQRRGRRWPGRSLKCTGSLRHSDQASRTVRSHPNLLKLLPNSLESECCHTVDRVEIKFLPYRKKSTKTLWLGVLLSFWFRDSGSQNSTTFSHGIDYAALCSISLYMN